MGLFQSQARELQELRMLLEQQRNEMTALREEVHLRNMQWDLVAEQLTYLCNLFVTVTNVMRHNESEERIRQERQRPAIILAHTRGEPD